MGICVAIAVAAQVPYSSTAIALKVDLVDQNVLLGPSLCPAIQVTLLMSRLEGNPREEFVPSIT